MNETPIQRAEAEGYLHRVIVALDQTINVILGGCPDETISSRCKRLKTKGNWIGIAVIWFCDLFATHHGIGAEEADLGRAEICEQIEDRALCRKD